MENTLVDIGLMVPADLSFPSNYEELVPLIQAEFDALPQEQREMFHARPDVLSHNSPLEMRVALGSATDKFLNEFNLAYENRKSSSALTDTMGMMLPPLHQLINLTYCILRFPKGAFEYGMRIAKAFGLIAMHWFTISIFPLPWGHQMARVYTLATTSTFPRLRKAFSTSSYYYEFYRAWDKSTVEFQNTVFPFLSPRYRFLFSNQRRAEYEEIMDGFRRTERHVDRGTQHFYTFPSEKKET